MPLTDLKLVLSVKSLKIKELSFSPPLKEPFLGEEIRTLISEESYEDLVKALSVDAPLILADILFRHNERWYRAKFWKEGKLWHASGTDITDLKATEAIHNEYGMFFKMSLDMACIAGTDAFFKIVNPAFSKTLGFTQEELLKRPFTDFIHPEDLESTYAEVIKLSQGQDTVDFENRYLTKSGDWKWLSWRSASDPVTGRLYAVARDITETRQKNILIEDQRRRLANVIKGANLGTWEWNIQTEGFVINPRWAEIIGYEVDEIQEIISKGWQKLIHFDDLQNSTIALTAHLAAEKEFYDFEGRIRHKKGHWVWIHMRGRVHSQDNLGKPEWMFGTCQEITDEKEFRIQLERSNRRLDEFAYVVSHDLKAPLRGINTLVNFLEEDLAEHLNEDVKHSFQLMKERTLRLQSLISDILGYSRIGRTKVKNTKIVLGQIVNEVISDLSFPENFSVNIKTELPTIKAPHSFLYQLLANLLSNSLKYNDKAKGEVEVSHTTDAFNLYIHVTDNGPGIPQQYHDKVFKVFQTLGDSKGAEGTGIGLSTVLKIMEEMGGSISVVNNPESGCTFSMAFDKNIIV